MSFFDALFFRNEFVRISLCKYQMSSPKQTQNTLRFAGLATQWMVMLLVAVWAGHKIDLWTKWKVPVFLIVFPIIALAVALWQLINELGNTKK